MPRKKPPTPPALPAASIGDPPNWMDAEQREEWNRVARDLGGVLVPGHRPMLEHYVVLHGRFLQDVQGERTMTASERQTYHSLMGQCGMTPISAGRIAIPTTPKKEDAWDKFCELPTNRGKK